MRIYNLLHELVMKFAPMDEIQANNMLNDATNYYAVMLQELKDVKEHNLYATNYNSSESDKPDFKPKDLKPITPKLKIIELMEHVFARYGFAIGYMILVPMIQRFMNGVSDQEEDPKEARKRELMQELLNLRS